MDTNQKINIRKTGGKKSFHNLKAPFKMDEFIIYLKWRQKNELIFQLHAWNLHFSFHFRSMLSHFNHSRSKEKYEIPTYTVNRINLKTFRKRQYIPRMEKALLEHSPMNKWFYNTNGIFRKNAKFSYIVCLEKTSAHTHSAKEIARSDHNWCR